MKIGCAGLAAVLAGVVAWGTPVAAHHSNPLYFDMTKAITLEGKVLRLEWINPHTGDLDSSGFVAQ